MSLNSDAPNRRYLGIDGGGTRTVALLARADGEALGRVETGPTNLKLLTEVQLESQFRPIATAFPRADAVGVGLAGAWDEPDRSRIRAVIGKLWPQIPCYATHDLEVALTAASFGQKQAAGTRVLMVSGTGSCCYGMNAAGTVAKVGGWGHILGDQGSGYEIGLRALQTVASDYDRQGAWPNLGARLLRVLQLNRPNDLIDWAQQAGKAEIAGLALEVFDAWKAKDRLACQVLSSAGQRLAEDAAACARKLVPAGTRAQFVFTGSILLKQPRYAAMVKRELCKLWPGAVVTPIEREAVWGAVELARKEFEVQSPCILRPDWIGTTEDGKSKVQSLRSTVHGPRSTVHSPRPMRLDSHSGARASKGHIGSLAKGIKVRSVKLSPTEQRNPRTMGLDKLPLAEAIEEMLSEDSKIPDCLLAERGKIEQVIQAIVRAFRRGGRLFYVGAGTSGRLGVLDASECPPTFSTPPDWVQGIIAGGQTALWSPKEGGEDDIQAGEEAIASRNVGSRDVVVGIAASGTTPFVWGALRASKKRRATTVLLCFNPYLAIPSALQPTVVIAPNLGPEVLTGSTRLKAGTATKLLLNIFTTLSMVRLGKVMSNLMVDVKPTNTKLRQRAVRIVSELTGAHPVQAQEALDRTGWLVKPAVARLLRGKRRK